MAKNDFNYNVLFFPDKEKSEPTAENVFIEIIRKKDGEIKDTKSLLTDKQFRQE